MGVGRCKCKSFGCVRGALELIWVNWGEVGIKLVLERNLLNAERLVHIHLSSYEKNGVNI